MGSGTTLFGNTNFDKLNKPVLEKKPKIEEKIIEKPAAKTENIDLLADPVEEEAPVKAKPAKPKQVKNKGGRPKKDPNDKQSTETGKKLTLFVPNELNSILDDVSSLYGSKVAYINHCIQKDLEANYQDYKKRIQELPSDNWYEKLLNK